jgi:flagellar assembly factor FliW
MKVHTSRFGEINVPEDSIYVFPAGLLGFPNETQFAIISENDGPLKWLQSISIPELAFVVCDPLTFKSDYLVKAPKSELNEIDVDDVKSAVVLVILVVRENPADITANLLGPLIFNSENRKAKQLVLSDSEFSTKHKILSGNYAATAS